MNNPEQQPNNSNLDSLTNELSLTHEQIQEYKQLSKEEQEKQRDEQISHLKALNIKLDEAIQEAIKTGNLEEALKLKDILEKEMGELEERMEVMTSPEAILKIDRSLDIIKFTGWSDAEIEDKDTDTRSTALTEIDLSKLKLDTSWLGGKSRLDGEKRLEALKASGNIRLDAQILITLKNLPKEELNKKMEILAEANAISIDDLKKKYLFFDGTIIKSSGGDRRTLCLYWDGSEWRWSNDPLGSGWYGYDPSLVLAS